MRLAGTFLLLSLIGFLKLGVEGSLRPRDYDSKDYYALQLSRDTSPHDIAKHFDLELEGSLGELPDHYLFSAPKCANDIVLDRIEEHRRRKKRSFDDYQIYDLHSSILFTEKQKLKRLEKRGTLRSSLRNPGLNFASGVVDPQAQARKLEVAKLFGIQDPVFQEQWHLLNTVKPGHDVNVTGVWAQGIFGNNVTVAIVDDGLDMDSRDLRDNYFAEGSWDFNDHVPEPKPRLIDDRHGTRCAGEIAAVKNDVCGVGVAWESKVSGIRILSKQISDADEAIALNYAYDRNHIYSCSWGPPDDGQAMDAPGQLIKRSIVNGIQNGRNGLGSIFVFASGNGAGNDDNCNFDGYTNSIYSITVGAVDKMGNHPYYSEACSANLVVTYSSGSGDAIHTTDVGPANCYNNHGGTSAAAPLAAGIFALVLTIRPDLTWRDMQYLCIETAVIIDENDTDWDITAAGKHFNHKYGYGSLDAYAIVEVAKGWTSVKPQAWYHTHILKVNTPIPEGNVGLRSHFTVTRQQLQEANVEKVEHVTITMNVEHQQRGDLSVDLISPRGIISQIATSRRGDISSKGYRDWTFMSVKHWGEDGVGDWTIIVKDKTTNGLTGTFVDWRLTLWGVSIDAEKAVLHPLPGDSINQTHPIHHPVSSAPAHTTTLPPTTSTTQAPIVIPTDHITRPVNVKPTPTAVESPAATSEVPVHTQSSNGSLESEERPEFIPSFLPTFGVSAKTQAWIYGAFIIIVFFVAGVGLYLCIQRKKRKRNNADYEFAVLQDEEEGNGAIGRGSSRRAAGVPGRRKARELYDAFGASDDDDNIFSSDDEHEEGYRDSRDYDLEAEEAAHGIDEGKREAGTDRERLLGTSRD